MEYRRLGRAGVKVSAIGLGGNTFGRYCDEEQSVRVIRHAIDLGVNFLDTADRYTGGRSEEYFGKAIAGRRTEVVLATKLGYPPLGGNAQRQPNDEGLSRWHIERSLEQSLRRLNTDYVDLYYMHKPDPTTPLEESLRALDDLVRAGKVRYVACSNFAAWQVAHANGITAREGFAPLVVTQDPYNLLERGIEKELIPCLQTLGIGLIPYVPLAAGMLTGKYRKGEAMPPGVRGHDHPGLQARFTDANYAKVERLERFAQEHDRPMDALALAWLLAQPVVASVIAGVTKTEQVERNVKAADWKLSAADLAEIEALLKD
ncbi:MAG: aldo/keto reductase [Chloroflexi bacterium]|nr:aldo/keto reductase [Chloroflexota bacterium]